MQRNDSTTPSDSLVEAVGKVPFGTMVGWRTPGGNAYGITVGREGSELLCLTIYDRTLKKDRALRLYRDEAMSDKLGPLMPGVMMDLQRVPANRAFRRGRVKGRALAPYMKAAAHLQLEGEMPSVTEKMWIQQAVKRPGRLRKILGMSDEEWESASKGAKLKAINAKLKTSTDKSERGALLLGKRFIGGDIGRGHREEGMDLKGTNERLTRVREALEESEIEVTTKELSAAQNALIKATGLQLQSVKKGSYGYIAKFAHQSHGGSRLTKKALQLLGQSARWVDVKRDGVNVGI